MGRQFLDVEHPQTVSREHPLDGQQRQVAEVLVIDGVELDLGHQAQQMGKLHRKDALVLEQV